MKEDWTKEALQIHAVVIEGFHWGIAARRGNQGLAGRIGSLAATRRRDYKEPSATHRVQVRDFCIKSWRESS